MPAMDQTILLTQTQAFAVVEHHHSFEFDGLPHLKRGHRIHPTRLLALAEFNERGGKITVSEEGRLVQRPACIIEYALPHGWLYDTTPDHEGWYKLCLASLEGKRLVHPTGTL